MAGAVFEPHLPARRVDRAGSSVELQVDAVVSVELRGSEDVGLLRRRACEISLREIGAVAGQGRVGAQHRDATGVASPSEHLGCGVARSAATENYDRTRHPLPGRRCWWTSVLDLLPDEHVSAPLLDSKRGHGTQRRRAQGLPGTQVEARVMPGAANRL